MMQHPDWLLMGLFAGLYLYDSAMLLWVNQAILLPRKNNRWQVGLGSTRTTFSGKGFYLPNPLWPTQALFELKWQFDEVGEKTDHDWQHKHHDFSAFVPWVWLLFVLSFVVLPYALFVKPSDWLILTSFALIYLADLGIILLMWIFRHRLGLTDKLFVLPALELLICPPFAINIIRRLSLRVSVDEDFAIAARRLLSPEDWQTTRAQMLDRLDDEINSADEGTAWMMALQSRRSLLLNENILCQQLKLW